jgi:ketosteroid isomerase-like protein
MKALLTYTIIVLLAGFSATCASAQTDTQQGAEEEVRRLSNEEVQAFLRNDPQTMARLWSHDFVVTNPVNKFVNKQDVLGMVRSGFLVITSYDRRIEYARVYGNIVILAGSETVVWGGKMPMAGETQELRFTEIWMKQEGRWQEIARHANIVPQQSPISNAKRDSSSEPSPNAVAR